MSGVGVIIRGYIEYDKVGAKFEINEIKNGEGGWAYHNIQEGLQIKVVGHILLNGIK